MAESFDSAQKMHERLRFDPPTADAAVATAGAILDAHVRECMRKRHEMLEAFAVAHINGVRGWQLVEEVSADSLRRTWRFEKTEGE